MKFDISPLRSVKGRMALFTLAVFLVSIWLLSYVATRELRNDLLALLGNEQRSTAALLGAQIRDEVEEALAALDNLAAEAGKETLREPRALQLLLEHHSFEQRFFNGGILILDADGTAMAEVPPALGRAGVNYRDVEAVAAVLHDGTTTIGRPVMGRVLKAPVFGMAVPIRDAAGGVVGVVYGVTNLGKPNFLDKITEVQYGRTGGFFIASRKWRVNITATDKTRVMEPLPPVGASPAMDLFVSGFEGTQVLRDPNGQEVMVSVRHLPFAGWSILVNITTEEVFEPIRAMERRMLMATAALSLLAGLFTWLVLRRELNPLLEAAHTLGGLVEEGRELQALPIVRDDEVGQLIASFNRLIAKDRDREVLLRERNAFISKLVDVIPGMVGYWSSDLHCRFANTGYLGWFGRTPQEMDNIDMRELLGPELFGRNEPYIRSALEGQVQQFERMLVKADGSVGYTLAHYVPDWHDGQVLGFFAVVSDITAVKHAQVHLEEANQALQMARDEAQRANQAKSNFLTSMSHELRTPLNSILGFAQLLDRDPAVPAAQREQVDEILAAGYHLLQLVKDIFDLAKVEAGVMAVSMEVVELDAVVQECLHQVASQAAERRIQSTYRALAGATVRADRTRLRQVLLNLLSNAIKYNREGGGVHVSVEAHGEDRVRVVVADTGAGIPADRLGELFQPFNRLDAQYSGVEGTGIGLSLSRRIASLMQGTVDVSSEVGTGSRFWIELARG